MVGVYTYCRQLAHDYIVGASWLQDYFLSMGLYYSYILDFLVGLYPREGCIIDLRGGAGLAMMSYPWF